MNQLKIENIPDKTVSTVFEELQLKEDNVYLINVKTSLNNVEHRAILFVGFNSGSYCEVYNNTYTHPVKMMDCHSIEIVRRLGKLR